MTRLHHLTMSVIIVAATARGAFRAEDFRYIKGIDHSGLGQEDIGAADLDDEVYARTRDDLADLRVRADDGTEVPFLVEKVTKSSPVYVDERMATVRDGLDILDDNRIQVLVHRQDTDTPPSYLLIETPLRDYEKTVRVDGRIPGRSWEEMVRGQRIFDYSRYMDVRSSRVELAPSDATEYRIEIGNVTDMTTSGVVRLTRELRRGEVEKETDSKVLTRRDFRINRIVFFRRMERSTAKRDVERRYEIDNFSVEVDAKNRWTAVLISTQRQPLCEFELQTSSRNFSREVKLQVRRTGATGETWTDCASGRITHLDLGSFRRSDLKVRFTESREQQYRLLILDQDSPPLDITGIQATGKVYQALFLASPQRSYDLLFGDEEATRPVYDAGNVLRTLLAQREHPPVSLKLKQMTENAAFGRRPRFGRVLNSKVTFALVVAVVVLVLGWGVYRAAKSIDLGDTEPAQDSTAEE